MRLKKIFFSYKLKNIFSHYKYIFLIKIIDQDSILSLKNKLKLFSDIHFFKMNKGTYTYFSRYIYNLDYFFNYKNNVYFVYTNDINFIINCIHILNIDEFIKLKNNKIVFPQIAPLYILSKEGFFNYKYIYSLKNINNNDLYKSNTIFIQKFRVSFLVFLLRLFFIRFRAFRNV